jgi:hypothetical protein
MEKESRKLACVSYLWSNMIGELVRLRFKEYELTNWVLSQHLNIEALDLSNNKPISNEMVMRLTNLKELNLHCNDVINHLAIEKLSNLAILNLSSSASDYAEDHLYIMPTIDDECLALLTSLKSLNLQYNTVISDSCLQKLTNLEGLSIIASEKITAEGYKNLTNLTLLDVNSATEEGLIKLTNLTSIVLGGEYFISNDIFNDFIYLHELHLYDSPRINYECFANLSLLTSLEIINSTTTDEDLKYFTHVQSLCLVSFLITNDSMKKLTKLSNLDLLHAPHVNDESIKNLLLLTQLVMPTMMPSMISDEGIKNLTNLINLCLPSFQNENISDYGIMKLTNLESIENYKKTNITLDGMKHLTKLSLCT